MHHGTIEGQPGELEVIAVLSKKKGSLDVLLLKLVAGLQRRDVSKEEAEISFCISPSRGVYFLLHPNFFVDLDASFTLTFFVVAETAHN